MLDEFVDIVPSTWESIISWFTPTVLFVLLNLMIGTILVTSNSTATSHQDHHPQKPQNEHQQNTPQQQPPKIARSPSVLQRIKSINFYSYKSQESPTPSTITHSKSNQDFQLDQTLESAATQYVFNQVLETHNQETLNPLTHFDFTQTNHQETPNPLPNIAFNPTHLQELPEAPINFASVQTHYKENPLKNTHFVYAHEDAQIINPHFIFDKTHLQEPKQTSPKFVLDQTHVEKTPIEEETEELQSMDEVYSQLSNRHFTRTTSDTKPASGEVLKKLPEKMKKSASMKSAFSHFEEEKIVEARRPETMRERTAKIAEEDDGEVDAKADDFINKFKHQLKLQRIDSIIRYKDMVTRGSEK